MISHSKHDFTEAILFLMLILAVTLILGIIVSPYCITLSDPVGDV